MQKMQLTMLNSKKTKIVQEKFIDTEYMLEQLANYLNDYVKEGSLKSKNPEEQETPESKWLLETLNLFAKTVLDKLEKRFKINPRRFKEYQR
jgi:hypothetical protein